MNRMTDEQIAKRIEIVYPNRFRVGFEDEWELLQALKAERARVEELEARLTIYETWAAKWSPTFEYPQAADELQAELERSD